MGSSKTVSVMSKKIDKLVDISKIRLISLLTSSLYFKMLGEMINTSNQLLLTTNRPQLQTTSSQKI